MAKTGRALYKRTVFQMVQASSSTCCLWVNQARSKPSDRVATTYIPSFRREPAVALLNTFEIMEKPCNLSGVQM